MKNVFNWTISAIGILCLVFYAGIFVSRQTTTILDNVPTHAAPSSATRETLHQTLININTADAELLQTLPGIGETLAHRIIAYREQNGPFTNVRQLEMVDGIGEGKMLEIIQLICTED